MVTEGPPQSFFDQSTGNDATIAEAADEGTPNMPPRTDDHSEDIHAFTALGAIDGFKLTEVSQETDCMFAVYVFTTFRK